MEDVVIWYNKEGRVYDCSLCSMPDCSSRNTTDKNNCLLDKREVATQELKNKVIQAPEKIYVADATFPDHVDFDGSPINTKRIDDHDVEYIRTDAFIEKARKWFEKQNEWFDLNGNRHCDMEDFDDFRNYMKGE